MYGSMGSMYRGVAQSRLSSAQFGSAQFSVSLTHVVLPVQRALGGEFEHRVAQGNGNKKKQNSWLCCVGCAGQRSLHPIQAHDPTTASSVQFCLLCCQPEPVPRSLTARLSRLTPRDPCRQQAWLGQAFRTGCRTCTVPPHFNTIIPIIAYIAA